MLEGFQTIKIKNVAKGTPKVTLDKGRLAINNPALRIINKDEYFDVGVNVKAKQICLVGVKVKKPQSLSGARKGVKRSSVARMIEKYRPDFEEFGEILTERVKGEGVYRLLTTQEQYYLLVFYAKNTKKSLDLKEQVVREMYSQLEG